MRGPLRPAATATGYRVRVVVHTEPVGSKAPKFAVDARLQGIERHQGQSFAMLCLAQGYPVPTMR